MKNGTEWKLMIYDDNICYTHTGRERESEHERERETQTHVHTQCLQYYSKTKQKKNIEKKRCIKSRTKAHACSLMESLTEGKT